MTPAEIWRSLTARGTGWYWMVGNLRNGDLFHVCSLAAAFAATHGKQYPIFCVVGRQSQLDVASLFADDFADIFIPDIVGLPGNSEQWKEFNEAAGLPAFGLDTPILPHPQFVFWGNFAHEFVVHTNLTWIEIYKRLLHLPVDAEPASPVTAVDAPQRAAALCLASNMKQGCAMILFPYAQSLPMDSRNHFRRLAEDVRKMGFDVFTSVVAGEAAVEGTQPIFIPFDLLIDVTEFAGWVCAIRSGICDVLSSARCRRTFVYPAFSTIVNWGTSAMGLGHGAHEIAFDFTRDHPEAFSIAVLENETLGPFATPPRRLTAFIGQGELAVGTIVRSFTSLFEDPCLTKLVPLQIPDVLIVCDVPNRHRSRLAGAVETFCTTLTYEAINRYKYYTCRDHVAVDCFEEVDLKDLLAGQYGSSSYWHSIVVSERPLREFLPTFAQGLVFYDEPLLEEVEIGFQSLYKVQSVFHTGSLMPGPNGIRFLTGWSRFEEWGLWSDGNKAVVRLRYAERPSAEAFIDFKICGCLTERYPHVEFDVYVNDDFYKTFVATANSPATNIIRILLSAYANAGPLVYVTFCFKDIVSPAEQGLSIDGRQLGIGLLSMYAGNQNQADAEIARQA